MPLNNTGVIQESYLPESVVLVDDFYSHLKDNSNPHGLTAGILGCVSTDEKNKPHGVASLNSYGKLESSCVPSYLVKEDAFKEHTENYKNPQPDPPESLYFPF